MNTISPHSSNRPVVTVREGVFEVMRAFGADRMFGNPGSTELGLFRDFPADFHYILGLQEAVVVGMADGYAQATGRVAFVNLHSAAGVGNAMGNIYTAFKNRTPLVIIAGQQSRSILPFDPYLASPQATELPKPYIKWSIEPARAQDVPLALATACHRALQAPCGPVLVSVPADDWDRPAAPVVLRSVSRNSRPDPAPLAEVAEQLARARRPAFVVGPEVDRNCAWGELQQLAERHRAVVFNAPLSARAGFPEDHRLFMGFLPGVRDQIVARLAGFDFVLVIGAPVFTYHVEGEGPHLPEGASLCQITEDAEAAARSPLGSSVVANVSLALADLLASAVSAPQRDWPAARQRPNPPPPAGAQLSQAHVLQTLAELRDPDSIIVEEAPTARPHMQALLPILRPQTFYTMASGGLGFGLPAAVGIAMARPERRVIALIGDGSSMYSIQSLWTAAQLKLNLTLVVLNNGSYAAMKRWAGILGFALGAELPGTDIPGIDFVALARGHGCAGARILTAGELRGALRDALAFQGPMVLEVSLSDGEPLSAERAVGDDLRVPAGVGAA